MLKKLINKTHVILIIVYLLEVAVIAFFKDLEMSRIIESALLYFGYGTFLIIVKRAYEKIESFTFYECLVFILAHPFIALVMLTSNEHYIAKTIYVYCHILFIFSLIYIAFSLPSRLNGLYIRIGDKK